VAVMSFFTHNSDLVAYFATMTLDTIVGFDIIVTFVVPSVSLLMSLSVMWRKNHL
jgi:hypothetical protein